jgi:RsiW-degrading membrane proteinase PrsW (M82 family)
VLFVLRWLLPALLPAALLGALGAHVARRPGHREPPARMVATFVLGALAAAVALYVTDRAATLTGLDVRVSAAGQTGALVFVFCVVVPLQEAGEVASVWPAMMLKRFDQPFDGVVYAACAALGFAAVQNGVVLYTHPTGAIWIARTLLSLPARVFCACLWGYALGRAKRSRQRFPMFPGAFVAAVLAHGLYAHFAYGRGPGAVFAVTPLLAAMGFLAWFLGRDLATRAAAPRGSSIPPPSSRRGPLSRLSQPPSLASVRAALRADDEPIRAVWILFGALATFGAMIVGVAAGVFAAHALHVDLAKIDEHDAGASAPVLLLGIGLLASFPISGWLVAKAAGVHTLLEPALAAVLALVLTLVTLGFAAPFSVVFALALSPIAWLLSCIGAWLGRAA